MKNLILIIFSLILTGTLNSQTNYQVVNEAYSHVLVGAHLDSTTIEDLVEIANLCPLEEGIAVYRARTLLCVIFDNVFFWEDECEEQQSARIAPDSAITTNDGSSITVYPNPTTGFLNINYQFGNNRNGVLVITDLSGKVLITTTLASESNYASVALDELSSGIYLCSVHREGELVYTNKIVLCK